MVIVPSFFTDFTKSEVQRTMSSKEGLRDRTLEYAQAAARDGLTRAETAWNMALPGLQKVTYYAADS